MTMKKYIVTISLIILTVPLFMFEPWSLKAGEMPDKQQANPNKYLDQAIGDNARTALFAAGCFWGVESAFRNVNGVFKTTVGYCGGNSENPTYRQVCYGGTGHAETVEVVFDPAIVTYEQLLNVFWNSHDPTTMNRQGPDVGEQYRSAIFYLNDSQREQAEKSKSTLEKSGKYKNPVVTEISPAKTFYKAEDYHQQYLEKKGLNSCGIK